MRQDIATRSGGQWRSVHGLLAIGPLESAHEKIDAPIKAILRATYITRKNPAPHSHLKWIAPLFLRLISYEQLQSKHAGHAQP